MIRSEPPEDVVVVDREEEMHRAAEWLAQTTRENLGPELLLRTGSRRGRGQVTVVREGSRPAAVSIVTPGRHWLLECDQRGAAETCFAMTCGLTSVVKVTTSHRVKKWLRPLLKRNDLIAREHDLLAMACRHRVEGAEGRWAKPSDIPDLGAYQAAYNTERATTLNPDWDALVAARRVAVLEEQGDVVAVVKCSGETREYALLAGTYTKPEARRRGHARRLVSFAVNELLDERGAVHLVVDDDNAPAIELYRTLGFEDVGRCYMAYLR